MVAGLLSPGMRMFRVSPKPCKKRPTFSFFADDNRFIALELQHRNIVDNAVATGRGFVTGLQLMAGSLKDRHVLVLGCGPVGQSAVKALLETDCQYIRL